MRTFVQSSIMIGTNVLQRDPRSVLELLASELESLAPQTRKAATYLLENPNEIGVSTIRELASLAGVTPNTFVRLAHSLGYSGYDAFREPFRDRIRRGPVSFPDRARWLQSLRASGQLDGLFAASVNAAIRNIEESFSRIPEDELLAAAREVLNSRHTFVLGVGVHYHNSCNFAYLAGMGMSNVSAIPRPGSTPLDDLARMGEEDVLIAMTCKPYRSEVVDAVRMARASGARTISISDSPASPIIIGSDQGFVVSVETPQFFPSSVSVIALLETLLSLVIAIGSSAIITRVENLDNWRHASGIYLREAE